MITIDLIEKTAVELQKLSGMRYFIARDEGWSLGESGYMDGTGDSHIIKAQGRAAQVSALASEWLDTLYGAQSHMSRLSEFGPERERVSILSQVTGYDSE